MQRIACLLLCFLSLTTQAEIYQWKDANGKTHFSDQKPEHQQAETVELKTNSYSPAGVGIERPAAKPSVLMYSTAWCGYCKKARQYFRRNHIPFRELDIEKSSSAKRSFDNYGSGGVPLIVIGQKTMRGFSASRFENLYKQ